MCTVIRHSYIRIQNERSLRAGRPYVSLTTCDDDESRIISRTRTRENMRVLASACLGTCAAYPLSRTRVCAAREAEECRPSDLVRSTWFSDRSVRNRAHAKSQPVIYHTDSITKGSKIRRTRTFSKSKTNERNQMNSRQKILSVNYVWFIVHYVETQ